MALHERFADWLEAVSGERHRNVEYEEIVGYHLEQAHRYLSELGLPDDHGRDLAVRAAARLGSAGRRAFARADMSAAANLLRRAAMLLPVEDPTRLALAAAAGRGADGDRRVSLGDRCSWTKPPSLTADDPRLDADLVLTRLLVRHHVEENLERWREEVAREAERLIPVLQEQRADAELAKAWRLLGFVHGSVCRYGEAAAAVQQAAEHARRANDARLEARNVSAYTLAALYGPTPAEEAIEHCEHLATQGLSDRQAEALVLCSLAQLRAMQGDFERARELVRAARTLLDDLGVIVLAASTAMDCARHRAAGRRPADGRGRAAPGRADPDRARREVPAAAARGGCSPRSSTRRGGRTRPRRSAGGPRSCPTPTTWRPQALWRSVRAKVLAGRDLAEEAERLAREAVRLIRTTDAPGNAGRCPARPGRGAAPLGPAGRGSSGGCRGAGALRAQGQHGRRRPGGGRSSTQLARLAPSSAGRVRPATARRAARSSSSASICC